MKTVISSLGDNEDAQFDLRFGRAAFFCIYDEDTKNIEFINNVNKDAQGGAEYKKSYQVTLVPRHKIC
jgi:predicted Fe-Mo cluster-binding NifX family protein